MNNGFFKTLLVSPEFKLGNPISNVKHYINILKKVKEDTYFVVFPELSITGYSLQDLFLYKDLENEVYDAIKYLLKNNPFNGILLIGAPIYYKNVIYNSALVINKNKILGIVPKSNIPNSKEYYEKRYFTRYDNNIDEIYLFNQNIKFGHITFFDNKNNISFALEICEDMWSSNTPSLNYDDATIIFNLSASNDLLNKDEKKEVLVAASSIKNKSYYAYLSSGFSESSSEGLYSKSHIVYELGNKVIVNHENTILDKLTYFDIDVSKINYYKKLSDIVLNKKNVCYELDYNFINFDTEISKTPFIPLNKEKDFNKTLDILSFAIYKRLMSINCKNVVLGISGGLDSTNALLVLYYTYKKFNIDIKNIHAVSMPYKTTSIRTKNNAFNLCMKLGVSFYEYPIEKEVENHLKLINHEKKDIVYENAQARYRTYILMDLANKYNAIVIGTSDMSEAALGFCTYNGDQMAMYNINIGLTKTYIRFMVSSFKDLYKDVSLILEDVINTPISPELLENQKTEDILGNYEINDFILYRFLFMQDSKEKINYLLSKLFKLDDSDINKYITNFFSRFYKQQYKRQASPDGIKILDFSLSPRGCLRLHSDIRRD